MDDSCGTIGSSGRFSGASCIHQRQPSGSDIDGLATPFELPADTPDTPRLHSAEWQISRSRVSLSQTLTSTEAVFNPPSPPKCSQFDRPTACGRIVHKGRSTQEILIVLRTVLDGRFSCTAIRPTVARSHRGLSQGLHSVSNRMLVGPRVGSVQADGAEQNHGTDRRGDTGQP